MQVIGTNAGQGEGRGAMSRQDRGLLLRLARSAVVAAARGEPEAAPEAPGLSEALLEPRACFVTLRRGGQLRGCIGQLTAREPLWQAVSLNATRAATSDCRFASVTPDELDGLRIEISVLTPPTPVQAATPDDLVRILRPGVDGVVLSAHGRTSTFLPQVWDELPDVTVFLARLSVKAGLDPEAWRSPVAILSVYQVEHFEEGESTEAAGS